MKYRDDRHLAMGRNELGSAFPISSSRFERLPNLKPPALPGDTYSATWHRLSFPRPAGPRAACDLAVSPSSSFLSSRANRPKAKR
jgi:hypothetical protein